MEMTEQAKSYMSRPCTITTDDKLWCVSGYYTNGNKDGGILVWCVSKEDAIEATMELWDTEMFLNLNYHKYMH